VTDSDSAFANIGIEATCAASMRSVHPALSGPDAPPVPSRVSISRSGRSALNPVTAPAVEGVPTGLAPHETDPTGPAAETSVANG
jgi:hypothetical protein